MNKREVCRRIDSADCMEDTYEIAVREHGGEDSELPTIPVAQGSPRGDKSAKTSATRHSALNLEPPRLVGNILTLGGEAVGDCRTRVAYLRRRFHDKLLSGGF